MVGEFSTADENEPEVAGFRTNRSRTRNPNLIRIIIVMRTPIKMIVVASLLAGVAGWTAAAGDVQQNWDKDCAMCHGKDGKGQTTIGRKLQIKDFTDAKAQASFTDADAAKAIKEGITQDGKLKMKAFGDKLSEDEIKALVAHVRSFKP